jgi:hypothetical protein
MEPLWKPAGSAGMGYCVKCRSINTVMQYWCCTKRALFLTIIYRRDSQFTYVQNNSCKVYTPAAIKYNEGFRLLTLDLPAGDLLLINSLKNLAPSSYRRFDESLAFTKLK